VSVKQYGRLSQLQLGFLFLHSDVYGRVQCGEEPIQRSAPRRLEDDRCRRPTVTHHACPSASPLHYGTRHVTPTQHSVNKTNKIVNILYLTHAI